jgi:hypothetical protein
LNTSFHSALLNELHKCKKAARIYVDFSIDSAFLGIIQTALRRDLVIDFFISDQTIQWMEENPFLLNKLLELRYKGLNVYQASNFNNDSEAICQIDFKHTLICDHQSNSKEIEGIPYESLFATCDHGNHEYRPDESSITISFKPDENILFKGKSTLISWEVHKADNIKIPGFGEVKNSGSEKVQVLNDTMLVLQASNKKQLKRKSIFLQAIENIQINYDIQFLNPASKKFVSLKTDEDTEGVFGITKGQQVKLIWNVQHADQVKIFPFDFTQKKGEHIFRPNGSLEISIQASLQDKTVNQRIIIHEYPMPVFTEKLANIDSDFISKTEISIKNYRAQAYEFVNQNQMLDNEVFTKDIKSRINQQEKSLMGLYDQLSFNDFYKEHSVEKLNKSVVDRLKSYFSDQPDVIKMINLLQKNNHE